MQFCKNGPEVPDRLLQAHEDGRVILFSGAGISYPAGLPGFSGLVDRLYECLCPDPDPEQRKAIKAKRFDTAIGLLENGVVGARETVRRKLAKPRSTLFAVYLADLHRAKDVHGLGKPQSCMYRGKQRSKNCDTGCNRHKTTII